MGGWDENGGIQILCKLWHNAHKVLVHCHYTWWPSAHITELSESLPYWKIRSVNNSLNGHTQSILFMRRHVYVYAFSLKNELCTEEFDFI